MLKIFLLVILAFNSLLFSQTESELILQKGLNQLNNFKLDESEKSFLSLIDLKPQSPEGYYFISQIYLWSYLGTHDEGKLIVFDKFAELTSKRCDDILDNNSSDFNARFYDANLSTLRAVKNSSLGNTFDAFLNAKNAVDGLEDLEVEFPDNIDVKYGLALFNYALSFVPSVLKLGLTIAGLSYNKSLAQTQFEEVYNKGNLFRYDAGFYLSKIYLEYLGDTNSSLEILDSLISHFPNNLLFKYQKGIVLIEAKRISEAKEVLEDVIETDCRDLTQTIAFSNFLLGELEYKAGNYQLALNYFDKYVDKTRIIDYLGSVNLHFALIYYDYGKMDSFREHKNLISLGNTDIDDDAFALRVAEFLDKSELTGEFTEFMKSLNYYEVGKYRKAIAIAAAHKGSNTFNFSAVLGLSYFNLGDFNRSIIECKKALNSSDELFDWMVPLVHLNLAKCYQAQGNNIDAAREVEFAESTNNSLFKNKIRAKIKAFQSIYNTRN